MSDWILQNEDDLPYPDGIVGGDGASDSVSIVFRHRTEPAQVTVYLYAIDLEERGYSETDTDGQNFDVEEQVEFLLGTDPDDLPGTEVWSDYVYDRPSQVWYDTVMDAEDYRDKIAASWINMGADYFIGWDGKAV